MGLTVFLNAADAIAPELLDCVDVLIVNEIGSAKCWLGNTGPLNSTIDLWLRQLSAGLRDVVITLVTPQGP
ncbi:MAG: hypothetical protein U0401_17750 [Anaerolineae bacterium]